MHYRFGCHTCSYLIPGCTSCSQVKWNTGIGLDGNRLGTDASFLTCDNCKGDERFVSINLVDTPDGVDFANLPDDAEVTTPVKCASCQRAFDGCSKCGTYG